MASVRPNGPLQNRQHARVQRTDSVKSEKSDKRVSFNKDVGVKHIPRGQKSQAKQLQKLIVSDINQDEWASCANVRREPPPASANEKEKEALDLVRLLDHVACSTGPPVQNHPKYTSRSLDRLVYKNNKDDRNDQINNKRNNLVGSVNNISELKNRAHPTTRTENPINKKYKSDVNQSYSELAGLKHQDRWEKKGLVRRSLSPHSSTDLSDTDTYDKKIHGYKSGPDLSATLYYDNKDAYTYHFQELMNNSQPNSPCSKSIDNLLVGNTPSLLYKDLANPTPNTYRSADNLIEVANFNEFNFPGYKSADNLNSPTYSNIDIIKSNNMANTAGDYRPKVGNIIKKFNAESDNLRVRSHLLETAGGLTEPDIHRNHNHNKPFSYIDPPLSSVQEIRKITPPRETKPFDAVYAQVNKNDKSVNYLNKDFEQNFRYNEPEHEYSAKIIITDERDKHNYRYNDDDTYETYEVQDNKLKKVSGSSFDSRRLSDFGLRKSSNDLLEEYNSLSSNNINMSSVGVQTDALPKNMNKNKKFPKSNATSPSRDMQYRKDGDSYLVSSTLVRQVNHGFGRTDRSPSPPTKVRGQRQVPKAVVPLLSDTDDSEADYRIRSDPLAKIRDQVMIREKLQEDHEAEELAEREHMESMRREILSYNPDEMRPLTIDEVDALSLEVDENGRKSLVVARQTSKTSSNGNLRSNTNSLMRDKSNTVTRNNSRSNNNSLSRNASQTDRLNNQNNNNKNNINYNDNKNDNRTNTLKKDKNQKSKSVFSSASPSRLFSTLDRNRKNNAEREKAAKIDNNKDKKKKRIKIKFFYDPRPQDNNNSDPLSRFTEYKGTSSDEKSSPRNNNYRNDSRDRREPYDSSRSRSREHLDRTKNARNINGDSSRESRLYKYENSKDSERYSRERPRDHSREYSRDHTPRRDNSRTQRLRSTSERSVHSDRRRNDYDSYEYSKSIDRRSERSGDRRGDKSIDRRTDRSYDRRDARSIGRSDSKSRERINDKSLDRKSIDRRDERSRRDRYEHKNEYNNRDSRSQERKPSDRKNDSDESNRHITSDYNARGSPDGRPSRTLSEKYRSAILYEPHHDQTINSTDETEPLPKIIIENHDIKSEPKKTTETKKKKKRSWPWSFLGLRGSTGKKRNAAISGGLHPPRASSRASSRASKASSRSSARGSHRPRRPSVRAAKIRRDIPEGKLWTSKDRLAPQPPKEWESVTLNRSDLKQRKRANEMVQTKSYGSSQHLNQNTRKSSAESSDSYKAPERTNPVKRNDSYKQKYFGDSDIEKRSSRPQINGDYRSLPNRSARTNVARQNSQLKRFGRRRGMSPSAGGSAGSSLQSSESEADSRQGSHASRASKASHVSTESNRSVYLHATAVADIPVHKDSEESPSEKQISRQSKRVSRSFSLVAPWKPRHYREKFDVEYDNRDSRQDNHRSSRGALPPRPPRRSAPEVIDPKKVSRSQSVYKDSKLAGWLRRRRHKEIKGI